MLLDNIELNKILIKEFEIFLNNPLKFNLIMQELEKEIKLPHLHEQICHIEF